MNNCEEIKTCIACGHDHLIPVLDLKSQPLANSFVKNKFVMQEYYPLAINRCEKCFHVQLTHMVNPDLLFKDYLYVSGTAKTQLDYFDWFANFTIENNERFTPKTVLDIGCNDGSQLDVYKKLGMTTYGVDPAENLHEISSKKHKVVCGYFDKDSFPRDSFIFDIITCQNAFAHNTTPLETLKNISNLMDSCSKLYITTSQADMILNNEFDTIYHEHISFYNIKSMNELCKRAGLNLIDVMTHPIHGTSYIFIISKQQKRPYHVQNMIDWEASFGLYSEQKYVDYARNCRRVIDDYSVKIKSLRDNGYTIIGYGASAKGNTFLNASLACPDFIIDDNPLKQGLFTPGVCVPVYGPDWLDKYKDVKSICFVPLAWNFHEEIKKKIKDKRPLNSDIFVRYFPEIFVEHEIQHHPV
jgi:SAM-dependent methyltransferase